MANIAKRPDGRWRARYRDSAGREHSRHFKRKVDAQRWLDDVTTAVTTGMYVDPGRSRVTVREWSQRWLATKVDLKSSTKARYEGLLRVNVLPSWGDTRLADVTHEGVAAWVAELSASGLAAATVRQAHRVLSLTFSLAVRDGRLARNPADHVPLPRPVKNEKVFLTVDQVEQVADAASDYRLAILFLAYTGVRFGELSALRARRLDLMRRRAEIVEAVAEVGGRAVFSTPKSHQVRSVPIPRFLVDEPVAAHRRRAARRLRLHLAARRLAATAELPAHRLRPGRARRRPRRSHAAQSPAHRRIAGHRQRCRREGRPADARSRERHDDARSVRPPVRRSTRRSGRSDGRLADQPRTFCGLFAD
jgi:integrase